ncbi:MAG: 3-oxoacyl-ACP synthase III [Limisphaerales bacterium]
MSPRYQRVFLTALGYELGPVVVSSAELEERLAPVYERLNLQPGQLEAWTGIAERRWWQPGPSLSAGALAAARKAMRASALKPADLGMVIYGGVCRENFEPATACAVADGLGVRGNAFVYDVSNACLGVLNGMIEVANRIELGQIRAGLVVSCETAREINEIALARLIEGSDMAVFAPMLATFTGGSGAVAVLLTDGSCTGTAGHRLLGAVSEVAPEHHRLCRWGLRPGAGGQQEPFMQTDSVAVLKHGVELGRRTWDRFLEHHDWQPADVDRVICHQVGHGHQEAILKALGIPREKDYTTFRFLGNMGTAALPVTAAIAAERNVLVAGQRVAFLGIGSGLTCLMLGLEW